MHKCPICGEQTEGAFSEGGIRWAICDDCMNNNHPDIESCPTTGAVDDCQRCGGDGHVYNDGFVLVVCPTCTGNRH